MSETEGKSESEEKSKTTLPPPPKKPKLRRTFGWYRCRECSNHWTSAYTWNIVHPETNKVTKRVRYCQFCEMCENKQFPYRTKQFPKRKKRTKNASPSDLHKQYLCGRCKHSKVSCSGHEKSSKDGKN